MFTRSRSRASVGSKSGATTMRFGSNAKRAADVARPAPLPRAVVWLLGRPACLRRRLCCLYAHAIHAKTTMRKTLPRGRTSSRAKIWFPELVVSTVDGGKVEGVTSGVVAVEVKVWVAVWVAVEAKGMDVKGDVGVMVGVNVVLRPAAPSRLIRARKIENQSKEEEHVSCQRRNFEKDGMETDLYIA